jgi:hypothetical protein
MSLSVIGILSIQLMFGSSDTLTNVVVSASRQENLVKQIPAAVTQQKIEKRMLDIKLDSIELLSKCMFHVSKVFNKNSAQ